MLNSVYSKYLLHFKFPAGTSRGTLYDRETWLVKISDNNDSSIFGIGECGLFKGLSCDDRPDYEKKLGEFCRKIDGLELNCDEIVTWPSIRFGIETALLDFEQGGKRILFPSDFTNGTAGIPINGLIWMGSVDFMQKQIHDKIDAGFRCLKLKVGALDIDDELEFIGSIRKQFSPQILEIRLDANGSFPRHNAMEILKRYAKYTIHSVEQPVKAGHPEFLSTLCKASPIPIALDEELIGKNTLTEKRNLLKEVMPQYIVIKPSLTGGFSASMEWITEAKALNIGWWITSALESNIGLNAIAQWTYSLDVDMVQGLGTGGLYTNNISSPLFIKDQELHMDKNTNWDLPGIDFV